jgi:hypothetical protein
VIEHEAPASAGGRILEAELMTVEGQRHWVVDDVAPALRE